MKATIRGVLVVAVFVTILLCLVEIASRRSVISYMQSSGSQEVDEDGNIHLAFGAFGGYNDADYSFEADEEFEENSEEEKEKTSTQKDKDNDESEQSEDTEDDVENDENAFSEEDEALLKKGTQVRVVPRFSVNGSDVLVYVHIQKTGGTNFEQHLVFDLNVYPKCKCKPLYDSKIKITCKCFNSRGLHWMWHRHSLGWPCGVHAGVTELWDNNCLDKWFQIREKGVRRRAYHYATTMREPIDRFLSEWRMVQRGATWNGNDYYCKGRPATAKEIKPCYTTENWKSVSFRDFVGCRSNLAFNRQTRMLADLTLSDCYRLDSKLTRAQRDAIMLKSAKENLVNVFQFVGLTEYQLESARLFEHTFLGLRFNLTKFWVHNKTTALETLSMMSKDQLQMAKDRNKLDIELYRFAKELFLRRLKTEQIKVGS